MSENVVPIVRTAIDMRTYARAVARAWVAAFGALPTKGQVGVLWAQYGIETGGGAAAACWNWNIGNVKHVAGDGHDFIMLPNTWEVIGGKRVTFQPPSPVTWFRAFASLDDAMREHFGLLRGKRYAAAWEGVEFEDCGLFARHLKAAGYFTADANAYAAGMRAHFTRWMASDAFDQALEELAGETPSVVTASQLLEDAATVHPEVPLPEHEPPPSTDE